MRFKIYKPHTIINKQNKNLCFAILVNALIVFIKCILRSASTFQQKRIFYTTTKLVNIFQFYFYIVNSQEHCMKDVSAYRNCDNIRFTKTKTNMIKKILLFCIQVDVCVSFFVVTISEFFSLLLPLLLFYGLFFSAHSFAVLKMYAFV